LLVEEFEWNSQDFRHPWDTVLKINCISRLTMANKLILFAFGILTIYLGWQIRNECKNRHFLRRRRFRLLAKSDYLAIRMSIWRMSMMHAYFDFGILPEHMNDIDDPSFLSKNLDFDPA